MLTACLALFITGGACAPSHNTSAGKAPATTNTATSPSPTPSSGGSGTPAGTTTPLPSVSPSSPSKSLATPAAVAKTMPPAPSTPPPAVAASCTASMSNSTPGDGGTETLSVTSNVPNAAVSLVVHYKTKNTSYSGTTDSSGAGSVTFGIGRPTIGYTVIVDVTVGQRASCSTAFTPQ
jgi:hypothetical protein